MLVDPDRARRIVRALHSLGVLIAIDDYGTGFSSLGYLRDLRVHALKLDKSFVVDLEARAPNRVIVESTVQMAHALGLRVVTKASKRSGRSGMSVGGLRLRAGLLVRASDARARLLCVGAALQRDFPGPACGLSMRQPAHRSKSARVRTKHGVMSNTRFGEDAGA